MIACVSPSDHFLEESISTLNYATRAGDIANIPEKNIDPKIKIINDLKHKIRMLQIELKLANEHIEHLSHLTGENPRAFGLNLMKVEEAFTVDGKVYKFEDTGPYSSNVSPTKLAIEEQKQHDNKQKQKAKPLDNDESATFI